jgi:hypothetical protein
VMHFRLGESFLHPISGPRVDLAVDLGCELS